MPRPPRPRQGKRKRPPEEINSSSSLEVLSSVRRGARATKKRAVEEFDFNHPDDDDPLPFGSQADPSNAIADEPVDLSADLTSRSVSNRVREWLPYRPEYYTAILRSEAPLHRDPACLVCKPRGDDCLCDSAAEYRCMTCSSESVCKPCLLSRHAGSPLHRVEKWNGRFFEDCTLTSLGLVFQVGHAVGDICSQPTALRNLMVFDLAGVHRLVVQYCDCDRPPPRRVQLLHSRWFPATIKRPSTAFAFDLLDFFHKLQDQNKCNAYDFYHAVIQRTDAAGLKPEIHRYNEISLILRLWVHLQLLKRGGAVLYSHTDVLPPEGSLAIVCPACPHPGKNTVVFPENESWKNTLFLGVDGCFKLKLKERGFNDPDLSAGLAYFVNEDSYQKYLAENGNLVDQITTCGPELHAVNQAHTKFTQGLAVTGVIVLSCRHNMVLPRGVVDLQKGERYVNVDYAVASAIKDSIDQGIDDLLVSFDVGCQWEKYFHQRLSNYRSAPAVNLDSLNSFRVAVPKFHIIGHGASCQANYNLAYMDGVGMTHGEGVETIWSHSGAIATHTRENGPGARHLILDDHWNGWNWRKYIGLGTQLLVMLKRACKWGKIQREAADSMTQAWSEAVPRWREMLLAYKRSKSNPNPFEEPGIDAVLIKLKKQLAKEDLEQTKAGVVFPHSTSPAAFLQCALDIEAAQRDLGTLTDKKSDEDQLASFVECRRDLIKNINNLHAPQRLYMPGADSLLDAIDPTLLADHPEDVPLWFPSALPPASRDAQCVKGLPRLEYRLRFARASNALHDIRRLRRLTRIITLKSFTGCKSPYS